MSGIGEVLEPLPPLPPLWLVLVNAGVEVPTGARVFRVGAARQPGTAHDPGKGLGRCGGAGGLAVRTRNDLEPAARGQVPVIGEVLDALEGRPGCLMARMSGSGGTCFALFAGAEAAGQAARDIAGRRPDWWVVDAPLLGCAQDLA